MTGNEVVLVALPQQHDRVWDVSSEDVPHMTLLYLGEPDWTPEQFQNVIDFVEHATGLLSRFGMSVDHRGTLGDKQADVLFFSKWSAYRDLVHYRNGLLTNDNINFAYQATEQFPEWIPHLTLGFPDEPAKEDDVPHDIGWVEFDRIALWTADSAGPTFDLKSQDYDQVVSMSDGREAAEKVLQHYGVKGMKWGVRRQRRAAARSEKKEAKADKKWEKRLLSAKGAIAVHNKTAETMNAKIPGLNAKYPKADLSASVQSKTTRAYIREYERTMESAYSDAIRSVHGTSPSGNLTARYRIIDGQGVIEVRDRRVAHAADDDVVVFKVELDDTGHISSVAIIDEVAQSAMIAEEVLQHYGVKGMKWGVRKRSKSSGGNTKPDTRRTRYSKAPGKLSDTELRRRIQRMEMERRYNQLNRPEVSEGRRLALDILTASGRVIATNTIQREGTNIVREALERRR